MPASGCVAGWAARVERFARNGFDGVEIHVDEPLNLPALHSVRRRLAGLGLGVAVAGGTSGARPLDRHVRELVDACAVLDAHLLCGPFAALAVRDGTAALADAVAYARELGVTLALGGSDRGAPLTVTETARLVDALGAPNAGVLYNTYRAHVDEPSASGAILAAGNRLAHVQIVDNDGVPPGSGQVRWSETFAALDAVRYDGWYVVETKPGDDDATALAGLRFLQRHRARTSRA